MKIGNPTTAGTKLVAKSMTVTEIGAMTSIPAGTIVYNDTYNCLQYWTGTEWEAQYYSITGSNGISVFSSAPGFLTVIGADPLTIIAGDGIGVTPTPAGTAVYLLKPPTDPIVFSAARSKSITLGTVNVPVILRHWFYETDPTSHFDPTSGIFTAPEAGYYNFSASISLECNNAPANNIQIPFGIFGSSSSILQQMGNYSVINPSLDQCPQFSITRTFYCAVGEQVSFRIYYPPSYMDMTLYHGTSLGVWESWFSGYKIK